MAAVSVPPIANSQAASGRLAFLEGLRAVAALFVVLHHMYIQVWNIFLHQHPAGLLEPLLKWMIYGHFSVTLFIVLSGFVMMMPIAKGDGRIRGGVPAFLQKRARRIVPPYYCALIFSVLMIFLSRKLSGNLPVFSLSARSLIMHLLLIHNLSPSTIGDINGAFWFIAVQVQLYLLFPFLVTLWNRMGALAGALAAFIIGYGGYFVLRGTTLAGLTPHYIAHFAIGMLGASIVFSKAEILIRLRDRFPWRTAFVVCSIATSFYCYYQGWEIALGPNVYISDLLFGLSVVFLMIDASLPGRNTLRDRLSGPLLTRIGGIAYSIYLVHLPIVLLLWQHGLLPLHIASAMKLLLLILAGMPIIFIFSKIFYRVCEQPFQTAKPVLTSPA